jgi:hypothetical protein
MIAYQLLARLKHLTLVGQNSDKQLEFIGTDEAWRKVKFEEEQFENA